MKLKRVFIHSPEEFGVLFQFINAYATVDEIRFHHCEKQDESFGFGEGVWVYYEVLYEPIPMTKWRKIRSKLNYFRQTGRVAID